MATIRSFDKPFEMVDLTEEINILPNSWGLIGEMGLFKSEPVTQHTVTVEANTGTLSVIPDSYRGNRTTVNKDDTRNIRAFPIPHFNDSDQVTPQDLQGKRAYGSDQADTEAAVVARKLERIRRNYAVTLEAARAFAITNGAIYAPNGTVVDSYYSSFGITRKDTDFVLGTATTDLGAKIEEVIAHTQDNILSGELVSGVTVLCSPEFFTKLINHASIKDAYKYYVSTQEPLRNRLGTGTTRRFSHQGMEFVEYRGSVNGTRYIPAGEAYSVPMGTQDTFVSYFSPANKLSLSNSLGEELYVFQYRSAKDEGLDLDSEMNVLNLVRRPAAVTRLISSN